MMNEDDIYIPSLSGETVTLTANMIKFPEGFNGRIMIPEGVRRIERECFSEKPITAVSFPKSIRSIGKRAFQFCLLKEIRVEGDGGKVKIEQGAFRGNPELTEITLGNCRLSDDIFRGCPVSKVTLTGECIGPERNTIFGFGCWHYTYSDNFFETVRRVYGGALGTYTLKGQLVKTNYNICVKCDNKRCYTLAGFEDDRHKRPDFEWEKEKP